MSERDFWEGYVPEPVKPAQCKYPKCSYPCTDLPDCRDAELVRADERKRADALAATIAALRDIVTSYAESKADFIARVRNVLGACPDQRVLHAVEAEREACAKVCDDLYRAWVSTDNDDINPPDALDCKIAIRARENT